MLYLFFLTLCMMCSDNLNNDSFKDDITTNVRQYMPVHLQELQEYCIQRKEFREMTVPARHKSPTNVYVITGMQTLQQMGDQK